MATSKFTYVYGAISPREGQMDWKIRDKINTERMNEFLGQVSAAHRLDLIHNDLGWCLFSPI